ncbi:MAG: hypothetical protein QM296_13680 [Bacillota bacterium]|nr:hypothetical protein [Bacillota bacterium]
MNRRKGLFILHVEDDYLDSLGNIPSLGMPEAGGMLRIWEEIFASSDSRVRIEESREFFPVVQLMLEQIAKGEKDYSVYYDDDFNDNIWSYFCERTNFRIDRPIRIQLRFVLNEKLIDYRRDPKRSNLYIHNLLRLIAQIPAFDIEIMDRGEEKDTALFSYEDTFNGVTFCKNGNLEGLCFSMNQRLGQLALEELQESFAKRRKIMCLREEFSDFRQVLEEKGGQVRAYGYVPYIYLYMGSQELREKMYTEHAIDRAEYEIWGMFHTFLVGEKIENARYIVSAKAVSDAYEQGIVKVHGGMMQLEKYKNDFLKDMDWAHRFLQDKGTLFLGSEKSLKLDIPKIMIYSEPKHSMLIRTNVNKRYHLTRVANEVVQEELAGAVYHYLDSIYRGDISLPPLKYANL